MTNNIPKTHQALVKNSNSLITNLDYALHYANLGWHVFPTHTIVDGMCSCKKKNCRTPGKHPMTRQGLKDATTDKIKIKKWWTNKPNANIAIRTGAISGISVIDIDLKTNGFISLEKLTNKPENPKNTLRSITGGKGNHLIYKHSGTPIKTRTGFLPGIDIRGEGGYIIAPPSLHISGSYYEWDDLDLNPIEMPHWLINEINEAPEVTRTISNYIVEGERNNYLTSVGGKQWSQGIKRFELQIFLLEENLLKCKPPLPEPEVMKIFNSLCKYKPGEKNYIFSWKRAVRLSDLPNKSKLILHTLADHMDSKGRSCYPTLELLEVETSITRKTVSEITKACEKHGFIKRYKHKSEGQKNWNYGYIAVIPE